MTPLPKKLMIAIALVATLSATFASGLLAGSRLGGSGLVVNGRSRGEALDLIRDAYLKIVGSAVDVPADDELARAAIKGMVRALGRQDPFASFYSPSATTSLEELSTGTFTGIGIHLRIRKPGLAIVGVIPGTPADEAGILPGDRIVGIDGQPTADLSVDAAAARIKGPAGSDVSIGVERDGETITFEMKRETIDLPHLESSLEGEVGYVRLFAFARGAGAKLRKAVSGLIDRGAAGIVLDLRSNGGGLFDEAIEVASLFIEDGTIVTYRQRSRPDVDFDAEGDAFEEVPLVVVVDQGTASASEIVAGAIQDTGRAVVVGMRTYGKASVQEVVPLDDSSALKLTIASYITPGGTDIDGMGIEPDVMIRDHTQQKRRAIEILRGLLYSESARG